MNYNQINIIGRITRNPDIRTLPNGTNMGKFCVAVNRRKKEEVDFFNCVCFGKTVDIVEKYVKKGCIIFVTGELNINNYENKNREKKQSINLNIKEFKLLSFQKNQSSNNNEYNNNQYEEEVPF